MMRIALGVEYDGSRYHGWQTQRGLHTVQGVLETALSTVADTPTSIMCAGRTDTGVHATYQVIHFDTQSTRTMRGWVHGSNAHLPNDVCVHWAREVPDNFHARYSALARQYRYIIYNGPVRPALCRSHAAWQYRPLSEQAMHDAAQCLVGEHDFTSFRAIECQSNTPMRNLQKITVTRQDHFVILEISANAFLHHMVRNIAGVLMAVGSAKKPTDWVKTVLAAKDRRLGAETACPYGLYLVGVTYPSSFDLPSPLAIPCLL